MPNRLFIVDVFAESPLAGNQLAVVVGGDDLSDETKQLVAAEMNFSETTFVAPAPGRDGGYRVRLFTPAREIAFAGHPILGTAWVVRHHVAPGASGPVRLELPVGPIAVTFDADGTAWFVAPPVSAGRTVDRARIVSALGLAPGDLDAEAPARQYSAGTSALVVPLRGLDALRRARLDLGAFAPLAAEGFPPLVYVFCRETHRAENDLGARFFFEAHGVREDPATGNGAAFLGNYLLEHRLLGAGPLDLRIEQGHEVRRPSLVRLRAREVGGAREVSVGGGVLPVVRGELL